MRKVFAVTIVCALGMLVLSAAAMAVGDPVKWSQPIDQIGINDQGMPIYWGWDQASWAYSSPTAPGPVGGTKAADDWLCSDKLPVTDIHWWGSYLGSLSSTPPVSPDAFWFGIYTDVPAGVGGQNFSTPGTLLWQYTATNYQQSFVGYDVVSQQTPYALQDAAFKYNVYLPSTDWFYQAGNSTTYWLSIVALYQPNGAVAEWGWKSRPHFWGDDAVASSAAAGYQPLVGPDGLSWDLSYELTTIITPEPGSLVALMGGLIGFAGFCIRRKR